MLPRCLVLWLGERDVRDLAKMIGAGSESALALGTGREPVATEPLRPCILLIEPGAGQ